MLAAFCVKHCFFFVFFVFFVFLVYWFFGFLVYCFFGFLVFPLNWDRLGSHKIDQKIAQNLNFGEDFARNHCKTVFLYHFLHEKHLPGAPVLLYYQLANHFFLATQAY